MSDRRPTSLGFGSAGVQGLFRVPAAAGSPPRAHAARSTPAARPLHSSVVGAERHPVRRSLRSSCSRCRKCRWRVLPATGLDERSKRVCGRVALATELRANEAREPAGMLIGWWHLAVAALQVYGQHWIPAKLSAFDAGAASSSDAALMCPVGRALRRPSSVAGRPVHGRSAIHPSSDGRCDRVDRIQGPRARQVWPASARQDWPAS